MSADRKGDILLRSLSVSVDASTGLQLATFLMITAQIGKEALSHTASQGR